VSKLCANKAFKRIVYDWFEIASEDATLKIEIMRGIKPHIMPLLFSVIGANIFC